MNNLITGTRIDMEAWLIVGCLLAGLGCCVMFWLAVLRPIRKHSEYELVIADFRREMSDWEHRQWQ